MQMAGEQRVVAPRARVWEALNDPEVLRASVPGCQTLERDGDEGFIATVEVKIGPIGARFKGAVRFADVDAPNGYTLVGEGNAGIAGSAKGSARVRVSDEVGGGTLVAYVVDAQVGGRLAQLGGPIIDATARQLAAKFFSRFGEVVGGQEASASAAPLPATEGVAVPVPATASAPAPLTVAPTLTSAPPPAVGPPAAAMSHAGNMAGGYPWPWVIGMTLAIFAGFMLGRSPAASGWVIAVAVLVIVSIAGGYQAGRLGAGVNGAIQ